MEWRSFPVEVEASGDGRTLYGRAVPYNVVGRVGNDREKFIPGVFSRQVGVGRAEKVKLFDGHQDRLQGRSPIGKTLSLAEQPDGLYGEWRLYDTRAGEDALKLVKAGEVTGLSIGFSAPGGGSRRAGDGVMERRSATLDHVALTHEPVYAGAQVLGVRAQFGSPLLTDHLLYLASTRRRLSDWQAEDLLRQVVTRRRYAGRTLTKR